MAGPGFFTALQFRENTLGQGLSQFDPPLVKRVDAPDGTLGEHAVLIEGHELAKRPGRQALREEGVGGTVALKDPVRDKPIRDALGLRFFGRFAESQRFRLGEDVGQQHLVMPAQED